MRRGTAGAYHEKTVLSTKPTCGFRFSHEHGDKSSISCYIGSAQTVQGPESKSIALFVLMRRRRSGNDLLKQQLTNIPFHEEMSAPHHEKVEFLFELVVDEFRSSRERN